MNTTMWQTLSAVLGKTKEELEGVGWSDEEVDKLRRKGYGNEAVLKVATRAGLDEKPVLKSGLIDYFLSVRAPPLPQPPTSQLF
mmetsp:Transcript_39173/g.87192  ORF Transcript_39173/g.87192 Transcript_39173/m.87192 type:complete len:84 (+) Transcript_39173:80-331(+)